MEEHRIVAWKNQILECCKKRLMNNTGVNVKDKNDNKNVDS